MADLRMRSKTSLNPRNDDFSNRTRKSDHAARILSGAVLACGSFAAKSWLFERGVGSVWLTERVILCAGIGVVVKAFLNGGWNVRRIEWPLLGLSAFLNFIRIVSFCAALPRMDALRLLAFAYFTPTWIQTILSPYSARASVSTALALALSILSDAQWKTHELHVPAPAYGFLVLYALASWAHEHTIHALAPAFGGAGGAGGASMLGALLCAVPAHFIAVGLGAVHATPALPLASLLGIVILATALFLHSSLGASESRPPAVLPLIIAFVEGLILFRSTPAWADFGVSGLLAYGASHVRVISSSELTKSQPTSRLLRSYLKTILANPESRKIFYFLMLNLCYMLVQMLYGVWTNSLGLISDAIHMAFDCMAIGMGLFASVMATWSPNERYTYGYGRIETLSGFANGIFLILISIFIIFEAIQRLLDPPEMNTSQLLLVSGLGLGVNLFGMFAMGGHHHGHSHGGHSHGGGGHSHAAPSHAHSHDEDNHEHGHSHARRESTPQPSVVVNGINGINGYGAHDHGHGGHSHDDAHGHGHDDHHDHSHTNNGHGHSHEEDHGHSHNENHGHSHGGDHGHSHSGDHGHSHDEHDHSYHLAASRNSTITPDGLLSPTLPFMPSNMRPPPIQIHSGEPTYHASPLSPITPAYPYYNDPHEEHHHGGGGGHDHGHGGHDHGQSHNMRGVFLHVMADTLGSVGVIISTLLIQWYGWTGFDPIASLFIAILIAASVVPLVMDCAKVLSLDVGERETSIRQALIELSNVDGLASFTAPRFWPKDGESLVGSIHIQLAPSAASYDPAGAHRAQHTTYVNAERVVDRVEQLLRSRIHGLDELAIQVEGSRDQPWCSCLNDIGPGRGGV